MIRVVNQDETPEFHDLDANTALNIIPEPLVAGKEDDKEDGGDDGTGIDVIAKPRTRTKKPRLYKVLLLNDDYTPMDFVIYVLEQFFNKSRSQATGIMLQVHRSGVGICGVFTYEVAETKVSQVMNFARQNEHPLQCTMEKE